ncbi:MASE3 domain-containing protein [Solibacillus silvestris]|uniref:MASE3 domain-containing protein n=1 Tax=Solibacillus silvestris TaxID=76853 RepID=UPI0005A46873|nr:MASE3 domain-containing protein [Solibacillus silvestris]
MIAFFQSLTLSKRLLVLISVFFFTALNLQVDFFTTLYEPIRANHVAIHSILEVASIFVALAIALHGWISFRETMSANWLMFSAMFVAVAVLDALHTVTFEGMPYFIIDSNSLVSAWFWIAARLTESIIFLVVVLFPLKSRVKLFVRNYVYLLALLYAASVAFFIFKYYADLPLLIGERGPTSLKNGFEYVTMIIHAAVLIKVMSSKFDMNFRDFSFASFYLILSSWLFTSYEAITEYRNMAGHVFKVLGYYYLLKHIYHRKIEKPYTELHNLSARHKLLLNSVAEGIYGIDKEGKMTFINDSAIKMLGYRQEEIVGLDLHDLIHCTSDGLCLSKMACLAWQTSYDGKSRISKDQFFKHRDGHVFPVSMKTEPMLENGEQRGTVITFYDLSRELAFDELQREKKEIDLELQLAVKLQESLSMQQRKWKLFEDVGAVSVPYRALNGDFYSIVPQGDLLMMAIADISGKGVPAAIQKSMMVYALEDFNSRYEEPHDVLTSMNSFVHDYTSDYSFVTLTMANYNKSSRLFSYSTGGHEPIIWYKAGIDEFINLHTRNPALGIMADSIYTTHSVELEPNDLIILYTDGVTECKEDDASDGIDLLHRAVMKADLSLPGELLAKQVLERVNELRPSDIHDDQTILILKA